MNLRQYEYSIFKQKEYIAVTKALSLNDTLLKRFKQQAILNTDNFIIEIVVEDSLTGKIYKYNTSDEFIKNIMIDLRKEKINRILNGSTKFPEFLE